MDKRVQPLPQTRLHSVAATAKPKVATKSGLLHGAWEDGVQVFRGVPYSEPPVGDRRFRSPIPLRWEGERDATVRPASYQINTGYRQKVMGTKHVIPTGPSSRTTLCFQLVTDPEFPITLAFIFPLDRILLC